MIAGPPASWAGGCGIVPAARDVVAMKNMSSNAAYRMVHPPGRKRDETVRRTAKYYYINPFPGKA
jgi:hypothetical protein